jgi:hypothetical protein
MKGIRIERPKSRRERPWLDPLPLDPRDPDVLRVKAISRTQNASGGLRGGKQPWRR